MDSEQKREKDRRAKKKYRAKMSPEKKAAFAAKWNLHTANRRANLSPEEKAALNAKRREDYARKREEQTDEQKKKIREQGRRAMSKYRANLSPEKRANLRATQYKKQRTPEWKTYKSQYSKKRWTEDEDYRKKSYERSCKQFREGRHFKWRYGITPNDYAVMLRTQNGKCIICGNDKPGRKGNSRMTVDHCHKTGKVRGLLCYPCNVGLGMFKDDPTLLRKAIAYLKRHAP